MPQVDRHAKLWSKLWSKCWSAMLGCVPSRLGCSQPLYVVTRMGNTWATSVLGCVVKGGKQSAAVQSCVLACTCQAERRAERAELHRAPRTSLSALETPQPLGCPGAGGAHCGAQHGALQQSSDAVPMLAPCKPA